MSAMLTVGDLQRYLEGRDATLAIKVVAAELDEIYRAARRCCEDAILPSNRPQWDGTPCVLVPEVLWRRLYEALEEIEPINR